MLEFMHKVAKVADDIMACFAVGLGLPGDYYQEVTLCIRMAHCVTASECFSCLDAQNEYQPNSQFWHCATQHIVVPPQSSLQAIVHAFWLCLHGIIVEQQHGA